MTRDNHISDAALTAFLDGQADAALTRRITAALDHDTALAQRLAQLDAPMQSIQAALSLDHLNAPAMPVSKPARWTMPLAMAACLIIGAFIATSLRPAPDWVDQVASYQTLYVTQTLSGPTQPAAQTQATFATAQSTLSARLISAPVLKGMQFKRAQMLAVGGEPLIQIAYLGDDGTPFALCITRVGDADQALKTSTSHDLAAASWVKDGLGYLLIGGDDMAHVGQLAASLTDAI